MRYAVQLNGMHQSMSSMWFVLYKYYSGRTKSVTATRRLVRHSPKSNSSSSSSFSSTSTFIPSCSHSATAASSSFPAFRQSSAACALLCICENAAPLAESAAKQETPEAAWRMRCADCHRSIALSFTRDFALRCALPFSVHPTPLKASPGSESTARVTRVTVCGLTASKPRTPFKLTPPPRNALGGALRVAMVCWKTSRRFGYFRWLFPSRG